MDGCCSVAPHRPAADYRESAGPDQEGSYMAVINASVRDVTDFDEPITVDDAYARSCRAALADSAIGTVGLELETHLVNLPAVADPVTWPQVETVTSVLRDADIRSAVTVEPGGQVELSGPPAAGIATAVKDLGLDARGVREALADHGLGVAYVGADPLRPSRRVNPRPRYRAMEQHYRATGRGDAGAVMMNSTAALQVNLQAGPERQWPDRVALALPDRPDDAGDLGQLPVPARRVHRLEVGPAASLERPGRAGVRAGAGLRRPGRAAGRGAKPGRGVGPVRDAGPGRVRAVPGRGRGAGGREASLVRAVGPR